MRYSRISAVKPGDDWRRQGKATFQFDRIAGRFHGLMA
jgi:hypothetical protein